MNEELRKAAQEILQGELVSQNQNTSIYRSMPASWRNLAESWLAEHPTDDDEPVTEEWLRLIGAKDEVDGKINGEDVYDLYIGPARWCVFSSGGQLLIDHHGEWRLKTRGDVLRFCAALGIKIKPADLRAHLHDMLG